MPKAKVSHDAELTALVDRAKALRVPISEMCDACGETHVTIWRWQYSDIATWKRREAFIRAATQYLDDAQTKYAEL